MKRTNEPKQQFGLPAIGIPAEVLFHPKLSNTEKILFGLIRNLAYGEKGCFASNNWLGGLLGVKTQTISNGINHLKEWEVIIVEYTTDREKQTRHIYLNPEYSHIYNEMLTDEGYKKINRGVLKNLYPSIKNLIAPYKKINSLLKEEEDSKKDSKKDSSYKAPFKNGQITSSQFKKFWTLYPKKAAEGEALSRWNKICNKPPKERPTWVQIKKAIYYQKKSDQWQDYKYIPHAATWLNQNRWLNDPEEMKSYSRGEEKPKLESGSRRFRKETDYVDHDSKL